MRKKLLVPYILLGFQFKQCHMYYIPIVHKVKMSSTRQQSINKIAQHQHMTTRSIWDYGTFLLLVKIKVLSMGSKTRKKECEDVKIDGRFV